ncbi:hypothetical protein V9K67_15480 [Paraflavisolibacter sp. H34]|uniref:hypothetical protein n=1 Tax=Huijunlia imazamoxiresistens TaxID=3127457 RepID=UPI00301AF0C8
MEWKFRKEFQVMPGIKLKYGKGGIQTEIQSPKETNTDLQLSVEKLKLQLFKPYEEEHEIKSAPINRLTPESLQEFKSLLLASGQSYAETQQLSTEKTAKHEQTSKKLDRLNNNLFKFLYKKKRAKLAADLQEVQAEISELNEQLKLSVVRLEIDSEDVFGDLYYNLRKAFRLLTQSEKKWDFTSSRATNRYAERTSAASTITRSLIDLTEKKLPILETDEPAMCFHNINGGDIYLYPGFLIVYESKTEFAIINYSDLSISYNAQNFIEEEEVPGDAKVVGHTWHKVNKDGSPDRRFSNNYQIPIALYGKLQFSSSSGLNEVYCFSNTEFAMLFQKALFDYADSLKKAESLLNAFK